LFEKDFAVEVASYVLRIATKQWVDHVFNMAIYYTSFRRKWKPEQTILFVHKTTVGDAIVGYGVIGSVLEKEELSEEDRSECEKYGWKKAITFKYVVRFEKPLPIKETFLKDSKFRGRYMHGLQLTKEQLESILNQAEALKG
jgi:hypothetical protein